MQRWTPAPTPCAVPAPPEVQCVGVSELAGIMVGRVVVHQQPVARLQRLAAELGADRDGPGQGGETDSWRRNSSRSFASSPWRAAVFEARMTSGGGRCRRSPPWWYRGRRGTARGPRLASRPRSAGAEQPPERMALRTSSAPVRIMVSDQRPQKTGQLAPRVGRVADGDLLASSWASRIISESLRLRMTRHSAISRSAGAEIRRRSPRVPCGETVDQRPGDVRGWPARDAPIPALEKKRQPAGGGITLLRAGPVDRRMSSV